MATAKVFMNGRSQAIRLPREFRVDVDEVTLQRTPEGFLVITKDPWELFHEGVQGISEAALSFDRTLPPLEDRGSLR